MTGHAFLDLLIIAVPVALTGLWWTGSRARELAIAHARSACQQRQVQFLDQTVALSRIRPVRNASGNQCLMRTYRFEFTDHADYRDTATLVLHGYRLHHIDFPFTRDPDGNRVYIH